MEYMDELHSRPSLTVMSPPQVPLFVGSTLLQTKQKEMLGDPHPELTMQQCNIAIQQPLCFNNHFQCFTALQYCTQIHMVII